MSFGGIPYTAHGAQITPPTLRYGQVCPTGLGNRFSQGPTGLEPPAGARIRKKEKSKLRDVGYLCSKSTTWEST